MKQPHLLSSLAVALSTFACSGNDSEPEDSGKGHATGGESGQVETGDTGEVSASQWCEENGYSVREFETGFWMPNYGQRVPDFTLSTLDGEWNFQENWSGCDNYLFVNHADGYDYAAQLWDSDFEDFLEDSPPNVHYFFMSYDQGSEEEQVSEIQEEALDALDDMSDEDRAHWASRLHFVTDSAWEAETIGDALQTRGAWAIGIDRNQQLREIGYLANPNSNWEADLRGLTFEARHFNYEVDQAATIDALNADAYVSFAGERVSSGYAELSLPDAATMATYDTMHLELSLGCGDPFYEDCGEWDYLIYAYVCDEPAVDNEYADTECQPYVGEVMGTCTEDGKPMELECREDTDCIVEEKDSKKGEDTEYEESPTTEILCEGYSAEVAADTLPCSCDDPDGSVAETTQTCNGDGTGYDECACACDTEIGRWITSYARGGQWLMDSSPALAFLKDGGNRTIRFQSSYGYDNTLTFHLSNQEKEGSADEVHYLYSGGSFNETYNDAYSPMDIDIPEDATRVELYAIISGHGWGVERENCAEFCNHTHHFTVNGTEYVKEHEEAGRAEGCVEQIEQGTVPNQFGTWPYGRGGWCAGKQVDPWIVDVTDSVTPGETATISYQGLFEGADYVPVSSGSSDGFAANINMRSYLVISR